MDACEKFILLVEQKDVSCQLNHGPFAREEEHPAVDYLVCPIGFKKGESEEEKEKLVIPICRCCRNGLHDQEWTLLYCLNCLASKWILRPIARLKYNHNLIWLGSCPRCSKKFGGIYFNERRDSKTGSSPEAVAREVPCRMPET
jgi:hypothetical protein